MKKLISILILIALLLGVCCGLSGCSHPTASVFSSLDIDDGFAGTRTVSVVYPLSAKIDTLKDAIIADDPTAEIDGVSFAYAGVEEDGYHFELTMTFADKSEYEDEVSALIGRSTFVFLSRKDTYLTHGTRMSEDFKVSDLIAWIINDTKDCKDTKKLAFDYSNTVRIGTDTYSAGESVLINECSGSAIDSIAIETYNDKNGKFNRTISFAIPYEVYSRDEQGIVTYFKSNTTYVEGEYDYWSSKGSLMIYNVIYNAIDIDKLQEVTALLLDTDSESVVYGKDNAATPLSDDWNFEENLDTFSFIGASGSFPKLSYAYSLPLNTTYGDGLLFEDGQWSSAGKWENDLYSVELENGSARLRIPDGIQYTVKGIDFSLETLGDSRFRRSTDFLYDKNVGQEGADYAVRFFESKGFECEYKETDSSLVCHVAFEGTTEEITSSLVSVFGSGNYLAYEKHKGMFDLSIKTELIDYVNIGYMLNANNINCPMTYYVSSQGGDNIVSISADGNETAYTEHSRSSMAIQKGQATIKCYGNIPVTSAIVIYIISGLILLVFTSFVAIKLIKPQRRRAVKPAKGQQEQVIQPEPVDIDDSEEEETDPELKASVTQTTTFSIFELNALVRNKKYVDEINKDVEERMRVQELEDQKKDIRARKLEEMSRMVYGGEEPEEAGEAEDADSTPEPADSPAEDAGQITEAPQDVPENEDYEEYEEDDEGEGSPEKKWYD